MYNSKPFIRIICKLLSIGVLFSFVIYPMHDEMDPVSIEKDIIRACPKFVNFSCLYNAQPIFGRYPVG